MAEIFEFTRAVRKLLKINYREGDKVSSRLVVIARYC